MKKVLFTIAAVGILAVFSNTSSATILFEIGDIDGNVNPIVGADEFAANDGYVGSFTIDMTSTGLPYIASDAENALMPGYLSNTNLSNIVNDGRPLTDATSSYNFKFDLASAYSNLMFSYGRYGSENDELITELYFDGNPFTIPGSAENNYQVFDFDFGTASAGIHEIRIDYVGGGSGNGHYVDYFQLSGTPVPEPATMLLLGIGLIGIAGMGRKKISNG